MGRALRALVGYSDRPMGVQLVAFLVVLAVLVGGARLVQPGAGAARTKRVRRAPPSPERAVRESR